MPTRARGSRRLRSTARVGNILTGFRNHSDYRDPPTGSILEVMTRNRPAAPTVLIVDDAAEPRDRLCAFLAEQTGATVSVSAADSSEVIRRFERERPACVIIDVPVHGPQGFELVATLRQLGPSALLIVLSNHLSTEFSHRSRAAGVDHVLSKASEFERVAELVQTIGESS